MDRRNLEEWVVSWFANQLEVEPAEVDCDASIIDLGLASSKLMMLVAELEDKHDIRVRPDDLFRYPTISKLVQFCSDPQPE